jgi:hypothetical protein
VTRKTIFSRRPKTGIPFPLALWLFWPEPGGPVTDTNERSKELCEQASIEKDPKGLLELVQEIIKFLEEKETRLRKPDKT